MRIAGIVLTLMLVGACVPIAIAGAGAGGYYVGNDEREIGVIADDASITASINTQYIKAKDLSAIDINVDTYEGVVTLRGNVPNREAESRAIAIAKSTKGVTKVIPELTIVD